MKIVALWLSATIGLVAVGCGQSTNVAQNPPSTNTADNAATLPAAAAAGNGTAPVVQGEDVAVAAPAPAPPPVNGSNANHYTVATNDGTSLNVRASNSTQSAIVGSIPNGTQVLMHISDRSGEWLEVSAPGNIRGWVSAQYLVDRNGNAASPELQTAADRLASSTRANQAASGGGRTYRVKTMDGDTLNLRSQPQLDGKVLKALPNGSAVTEVGVVGRWTEVVAADGTRGYVATDYLVAN